MSKKKKYIFNNGYLYTREELLKKIKVFPNFKLNKAQLLSLFPDLTSNKIKYMTSTRCKHNDRIPIGGRIGNKPYFIYNQVDAWNNKDRSKVKGKPNKGGAKKNDDYLKDNSNIKNLANFPNRTQK